MRCHSFHSPKMENIRNADVSRAVQVKSKRKRKKRMNKNGSKRWLVGGKEQGGDLRYSSQPFRNFISPRIAPAKFIARGNIAVALRRASFSSLSLSLSLFRSVFLSFSPQSGFSSSLFLSLSYIVTYIQQAAVLRWPGHVRPPCTRQSGFQDVRYYLLRPEESSLLQMDFLLSSYQPYLSLLLFLYRSLLQRNTS